MSGLEPLVALGLACSVMQTITFAGQTLSLCRNIYNDGQPDPALNDYSLELSKISETLKDNLNKGSGVLSSDDLALRDTAEKCLEVTTKLTQEMQNLSPQNGQKGVRISIRLGFKTLFRKPRLEQLEASLRNIQSAMNTQLLVRTLNRVDAATIKQQGALTDSRRLLEDTIQQCSSKNETKLDLIAQGNTETRDQLLQAMNNAQSRMEAHIKTESSKNIHLLQTHITTVESNTQRQVDQFQAWKDEQNEQVNYQSLLQSLKFENMEERKNQIDENYPQTCHWIFEEPDEECDGESFYPWPTAIGYGDYRPRARQQAREGRETPWDSFTDWLGSGDPIYWISGKPGSGKSTLMKFVSSNPKTKSFLKEWQPEVQIFSHYFWKAGSEMQQSLKGLLCSLMYQIFCENRQVALDYLRQTREIHRKPSTIADWDTKKLEALLHTYIRESVGGICLFVDGLDEFTPRRDYHDLLSLLKSLLGPRVKICISSRPERILENHLQSHANLRMQDFTESDMRKYASGCLGRAVSPIDQELDTKFLVQKMIRMADGVFLWVVLVSKSLAIGIENGDSDPELTRRLDSMPGDLAALYKDMWLRSNDDHGIYQETASWFFNIIFARQRMGKRLPCVKHESVSVFELMAATDPTVLEQFLDRGEELSPVDLDRRCSRIAKAVETRSAGLLVLSKEPPLPRGRPGRYDTLEYYANTTVGFIHRTAFEYLLHTQEGRGLWQTSEISTNEALTRLVRACLLRCHIWKASFNGYYPLPREEGFSGPEELPSFLLSTKYLTEKDGSPPLGLLSAIERAHENGILHSLPLSFAVTGEAVFLSWAGLSGLVDYALGRVSRMQSRDDLIATMKMSLSTLCARHFPYGGVDRNPMIRKLLQQGITPSVDGTLTKLWNLYLKTTLDTVSNYRSQYGIGYGLGLEESREIMLTLKMFLEIGSSLSGNIPVLITFTGGLGSSGYAKLDSRRIHSGDMLWIILRANSVWLINAILEQLDPEANMADIGHERAMSSAKSIMVVQKNSEDGYQGWRIQYEDAYKVADQVFLCLRRYNGASGEESIKPQQELWNMTKEVADRSEQVDEDEVARCLRRNEFPSDRIASHHGLIFRDSWSMEIS
ncbi:NACHT domain-containing protein [Fusarium sp. LHS14.1]|nr:NACHT domain-containing protein [Fusarium sp. LHS14.1]